MRYLECCPACGFQERLNWRPRYMDIEMDLLEWGEVPDDHPLKKLVEGESMVIGQWAHYRTRTGRYVYRLLASEAKHRGFGHRKYKLGVSNSPRKKMQAAINRNLMGKRKTPLLESFTR